MAWWAARTKTGRVVYDRPKQPFTWKDVDRITKRLQWDRYQWPAWLVLFRLLANVQVDPKVWTSIRKQVPEGVQAEYEAFGGGGFGGAGATRPFWWLRPIPPPPRADDIDK